MYTGIQTLDEMLGGKGIPDGSIVLLRGGPGTGKTTMALQMVRNHLAKDPKRNCAIFVSLETDPQAALNNADRAFAFGISGNKRLIPKGAKEAREAARKKEWWREFVGKLIKAALDTVTPFPPGKERPACLVVIDSLNLLSTLSDRPIPDRRRALYEQCLQLQGFSRQATVLLIAEFDPDNEQSGSVAAESFFCDVDIQLAREPVVKRRADVPGQLTTAGGLSGQWSQPDPHRPETHLFCRVIKARTAECQSRRCAYDLVSGQGVRFYDTYPADGQIMLFAENFVQQQEWESFFATDLVQLYPALRYGLFGRTGLQRTFASLRHFRDIPERTELYLSSFDTYWINWYQELNQRFDLAMQLEKTLPCGKSRDPDFSRRFARIIGKTHLTFGRALGDRAALRPNTRKLALDLSRTICSECPKSCQKDLAGVLGAAWTVASDTRRRGGLLRPLDAKQLKLFGEQPSKVIRELDEEGLFRPRLRGPREEILAVPYNANVGMLVCRKDLLTPIINGLMRNRRRRQELENRIVRLHEKRVADLREFFTGKDIPKGAARRIRGSIPEERENESRVVEIAHQRVEELLRTGVPSTWEEIIAILAKEKENGRNYHFLIETRTFDTQLCTLLEWIWGVGGGLKVSPDYSVEDWGLTAVRLFEAFWIFRRMRASGMIPRNSTLDVKEFANHYGKKARPQQESGDWLFARHWHSTLVDILTAREDEDKNKGFVWEAPRPGIELQVAPVPVSLSKYLNPPSKGSIHEACRGEWYFACLKGSENAALAVDLINNLMSSRKVCERAFSCAGVPTVQAFYDMYGEVECFNIPDRIDVKLPEITFADLRQTLLFSARQRM